MWGTFCGLQLQCAPPLIGSSVHTTASALVSIEQGQTHRQFFFCFGCNAAAGLGTAQVTVIAGLDDHNQAPSGTCVGSITYTAPAELTHFANKQENRTTTQHLLQDTTSPPTQVLPAALCCTWPPPDPPRLTHQVREQCRFFCLFDQHEFTKDNTTPGAALLCVSSPGPLLLDVQHGPPHRRSSMSSRRKSCLFESECSQTQGVTAHLTH